MMKTVLITGASRGVGRALAEKFLAEDYKVIGTSTDGIFEYKHDNLTPLALDLRKDVDIQQVAQYLIDHNIVLDVLINNAGVLRDIDETKVIVQKLRETLEVNLIGTIALTEALISQVGENGKILNISSSAGKLNKELKHSNYPSYKISKVALNMYTRTLAKRLELEDRKITVMSVHPGWVQTDMGGDDADLTPKESADYIYDLIQKEDIESGRAWFKGEVMDW